MRLRSKYRMRNHRDFEPYWLFAEPTAAHDNADDLRLFYCDMRTGSVFDTFPTADIEQREQRRREQRESRSPRERRRSTDGFYSVVEVRCKEREHHEAPLRAAAAVAEKQTRQARWLSLRTRPRSCVELMQAAVAVGIDLVARPDLAFIAELVLAIPMPCGWQVADTGGGEPLYRNVVSNLPSNCHPLCAFACRFL